MIDIHELKSSEKNSFLSLWEKTFGDSREEILEFLDAFFGDVKCFSLTSSDCKNDVLSALTLFKMGTLYVPNYENSPDVFVSYAICTDKNSRGRGYGASITNFASTYVTKLKKDSDGYGTVSILSPASKSLVDFYKPLGYKPFFFSKYYSLDEVSIKTINLNIFKISHSEYNLKREEYLKYFIHISLSSKSLIYLSKYSKFIYFENSLKNISGIAVYSKSPAKDEILISELLAVRQSDSNEKTMDELFSFLSEDENKNIANEIAISIGAKACNYRTPAYYKKPLLNANDCEFSGNFPVACSDEIVQGMIYGDLNFLNNYADESKFSFSYLPYLGFPFD